MQKVDQILEGQARLEIKLDALMHLAMQALTHVGIEFDMDMRAGYVCPLCKIPTKFQTNVTTGGVERVCACGTGCLPTVNIAELKKLLGVAEEEKKDGQHGESRVEQLEETVADIEAGESDRSRRSPGGGGGLR